MNLSNFENEETDLEKLDYLQNLLIARSTGGCAEDFDYNRIRRELLNIPNYTDLIPRWIKTSRHLDQFWGFIKQKFPSYEERRQFIYSELTPLFDFVESKQTVPASKDIKDILSKFNSEGISFAWQKALERKQQDPEGAITISRTILESVCKHILHDLKIEFNETNIELSELYKLTAEQLNLAPEKHQEKIFKQILGGCSGIVSGLGSLRNKLGDAHGSSPRKIKPKARHAEFAVNLSGTMALFLLSTYQELKLQK